HIVSELKKLAEIDHDLVGCKPTSSYQRVGGDVIKRDAANKEIPIGMPWEEVEKKGERKIELVDHTKAFSIEAAPEVPAEYAPEAPVTAAMFEEAQKRKPRGLPATAEGLTQEKLFRKIYAIHYFADYSDPKINGTTKDRRSQTHLTSGIANPYYREGSSMPINETQDIKGNPINVDQNGYPLHPRGYQGIDG
ncbi:MAG: hypothetical protein KDK71_10700, partial [Chlamydiia bacterium]|nr:hypothetical protein [Chlamydiia bacterium]